MKLAFASFALAAAALTGCDSPGILSLDPVATAGEAISDPALPGTWEIDKGDAYCIIRRVDAGYKVTWVNDDTARTFDALLFRVGDVVLLDLSPHDSDDFSVTGHALIRVWTGSSTLRWAYLDSEWLQRYAAAELAPRLTAENRMTLTAPPAAIRAFLAKYAADERAHGEVSEWRRML